MSSWPASSNRRRSPAMHSNLQTLLKSVTPIIPGRILPQTGADSKVAKEYFTLSELWESFYEWSACGAGCPIMLRSGERVIQFYCPYLSAIQIFPAAKSPPTVRKTSVNKYRAETEGESLSDDSESDKSSRLSNNSSKTWDVSSGDSSVYPEGSMAAKDCQPEIYFEFYDRCSPYFRVPLMEKVVGISKKFPGIMTFKSTDLSATSWMAIAWYPIYHIPFKRTIKDLSACFLTFHMLSSCYQETMKDSQPDDNERRIGGYKIKARCNKKGRVRIALPPFALATYKLQGEVWRNPFTADEERFNHLHRAAYSWLKQLNVQHHDFNFFALHSHGGMGRGMYV